MENLKVLSPVAKVISKKESIDKNKREFVILRLEGLSETIENHGGIQIKVKSKGRQVSMTQWKENYLNNSKDDFYDAKVGDHLGVEILTAQTEPYKIIDTETGEEREVTSYTFACPRGDNPLQILKNNGIKLANSEVVAHGDGAISDDLEEFPTKVVTQE